MRLISLNVWLGKLREPLIDFLRREASTTDIFCFQEITCSFNNTPENPDLFSTIAKALSNFQGFFESSQEEGDIQTGLGIFIKRRIDTIDKEGDYFVYRTRNAMIGEDWRTQGRNAQFVQFPISGKECVVVNFHGIADGKGREDSEARISQSKKLKKLLDTLGGSKIVCGDFNLTLATESLAIIDGGMRNMIKESGIISTRNRFFPYPDKFCDYILVDKDLEVKEFRVFEDEISDHLALLLDFAT
jgi:endonuclease/exonuclease/phosphatase family metal-dependent hydrolase